MPQRNQESFSQMYLAKALEREVLFTDGDDKKINPSREKFLNAYTVGPQKVKPQKLFFARVTANSVQRI